MRHVMHHGWRYGWPGLVALALCAFVGVLQSLPALRAHAYLDFGLYYMAARTVRAAMAPWLLPLAILLYGLALAGWLGARRLPRLRFLPPALVLLGVTAWSGYQHLSAVRCALTVFMQDLRPRLLTPSVLLWALGFCVIVLLVLRFRQARPTHATSRPAWPRRLAQGFAGGLLTLGVLLFVGIFAAEGWFQWRIVQAAPARPNIIFIMVDTLRADHVGCYGYDLPITPNIDALAAHSTRFTHALSQAPWTLWSVHSMMTSRYPDRLFPPWRTKGVGPGGIGLETHYPSLPKVLQDLGYTTYGINSNPWLSRGFNGQRGYDYYDDTPSTAAETQFYTSPLVLKGAKKVLPRLNQSPFFLYVCFLDPHDPYLNNPGFAYPPSAQNAAIRVQCSPDAWPREMDRERSWRLPRYNSDIGYTDHYVGLFLNELKRQKLYDSSLIVFFSDHGEEFYEHGQFGHQNNLYLESLSVPLLIKFPHQQQGRLVTGTFPLLDLAPSVLRELGIDPKPLGMQGDAVDLRTIQRCADKPIYCTTNRGIFGVRDRTGTYITNAREHAVVPNANAGQVEYYDRTRDPWEQRNLAQRAPAPDRYAAWMRDRDQGVCESDARYMAYMLTHGKNAHGAASHANISAPVLNNLRALGYLQ